MEREATLPSIEKLTNRPFIDLLPLIDPAIEADGCNPRSQYVEVCWLPVLGPTATLLYRRLGTWAEAQPEGSEVDLVDLSLSLGLGESLAPDGLLPQALGRLGRYDIIRCDRDSLAVRRALPLLEEHQLGRLSFSAYQFHRQCVQHHIGRTAL